DEGNQGQADVIPAAIQLGKNYSRGKKHGVSVSNGLAAKQVREAASVQSLASSLNRNIARVAFSRQTYSYFNQADGTVAGFQSYGRSDSQLKRYKQ
ncbi:unnamed protein product, partial [Durusdinium trenchii]